MAAEEAAQCRHPAVPDYHDFTLQSKITISDKTIFTGIFLLRIKWSVREGMIEETVQLSTV